MSSYYLDRKEKELGRDHKKEVNELAYISYGLKEENSRMIKEYEAAVTKAEREDKEKRVEENEGLIEEYSLEMNRLI